VLTRADYPGIVPLRNTIVRARTTAARSITGLPIQPNRLESYGALSSLDDLSHFRRRLLRPIRWADSSGDVMTTSKRTTRGAGSRPGNGAATPSAPPQNAAPTSATPPPSTAPPGGAPPKARARQRKSTSSPSAATSTQVSGSTASRMTTARAQHAPADRYASIAQAAYFRSQLRGFKPGHEMEDWLAAEAEVDQRLRGEGRISGDSPG